MLLILSSCRPKLSFGPDLVDKCLCVTGLVCISHQRVVPILRDCTVVELVGFLRKLGHTT